jgi:type I restriction enzyme S subunit
MKLELHSIADMGKVVTGKTPSTKNALYWDGEYPFVTPSDLEFRHYRCGTTERYVSSEAKDRFRNQFIPEGAVMFTSIGNTIGKCAIATTDSLTNQQINSIIANEESDNKYIYYLLCNNVEQVRVLGGGSATPIVKKTTFENIRFRIHDFPAQQRIASILSTYDDLIENNLRRIKLLEDSARQLYKEWFVRLRFPGYEHTKCVKGVPNRWEKGKISDYYYTGSGGTPSRKVPEYFTGDILWVKTQELQNEFIIDTNEKITEAALNNSSARMFPKWSVLIAMYGATIGQLGILAYSATTNQACCSLFSKRKDIYNIFAYLFLRENKQNLVNLGQGSAQNNVNQEVIKDFEMIFPSKNIIDNFVESLEPSFNQILNLQIQNLKLKQARDILLPKLMCGEVEV